MNISAESFQNLALETKASTSVLKDVHVTINPDMVRDYAAAYYREMNRTNPLKTEKIAIDEQRLEEYFLMLLSIRVQSLAPGGYKFWRNAKRLFIPAWIQYVLSTVGIVTDHYHGYKFIPEFNYEVDFDKAYEVSEIIDSYTNDGLVAAKDAFPRLPDGDKEVMSFIVVHEMMMSRFEDCAPIAAYVAAFLGLDIQREPQYKVLFDVAYEDVNFIRTKVAHERSIICAN